MAQGRVTKPITKKKGGGGLVARRQAATECRPMEARTRTNTKDRHQYEIKDGGWIPSQNSN